MVIFFLNAVGDVGSMKTYQTIGEVADDLSKLSCDIESLKKEVVRTAGILYDCQDARLVALDAMQCNLIACRYWITAAQSLERNCHERFGECWEPELRNRLGAELNYRKIGGNDGPDSIMLNYLRHSLTVMIQFNIENLFSNLLRSVSNEPPRNFKDIVLAMLSATNIASDGYERNVLMALAYVRNSFHNNGIHRNDNFIVCIDGAHFEFRRDQKIRCASWNHLVLLIREIIKLLRTILLCPTISGLYEVKDDFASDPVP